MRHLVRAVSVVRPAPKQCLAIIGEIGVSGVHVRPLEIESSIPVPSRSEGKLTSFVAEEEDAAWCGELHVVEILLKLDHADVGADVHQAVHCLIVLRLDGLLEFCKLFPHVVELVSREVLRVLHRHRHVVHLCPKVVAGTRVVARSIVHVEREQQSLHLINGHAVAAHFHLLGNLIDAFVLTIDEKLGESDRCGKRQPHPISSD